MESTKKTFNDLITLKSQKTIYGFCGLCEEGFTDRNSQFKSKLLMYKLDSYHIDTLLKVITLHTHLSVYFTVNQTPFLLEN